MAPDALPKDGEEFIALEDDSRISPHSPIDDKTRARIVLADDNADMRDYVRRFLMSEYEVIAVADGQQALQAMVEHKPDLVLTDVMMPKLGRFRFVEGFTGKSGDGLDPSDHAFRSRRRRVPRGGLKSRR